MDFLAANGARIASPPRIEHLLEPPRIGPHDRAYRGTMRMRSIKNVAYVLLPRNENSSERNLKWIAMDPGGPEADG